MLTFELYRYTHPDGSAKEWAYCDLRNGQALVRWGPADHLGRQQSCPAAQARQRARRNLRTGYVHLGKVSLNQHGIRPRSTAASAPDATATTATRPVTEPVDLSTLLGADQGFYF
ncbi:hypothetical protein CCR82_04965 [Halochromatium salexigens]|uniref:Uncharacterized protein n=1 Tax=Halochromatium salexigens TaxID=49447 RepID=A0AAJ0XFN9_HALSE|nr:hypothetical protein [Halochromatium salexigens]